MAIEDRMKLIPYEAIVIYQAIPSQQSLLNRIQKKLFLASLYEFYGVYVANKENGSAEVSPCVQRGRTDYKSYALFIVLIRPTLRYHRIRILFESLQPATLCYD